MGIVSVGLPTTEHSMGQGLPITEHSMGETGGTFRKWSDMAYELNELKKNLVVNLYYKPFKTVLRKAQCDQLWNNFKTFKGILRKPRLSLKTCLS